MRHLYLLAGLMVWALSGKADVYKGYIVTLNGQQLTGQIGDIYYGANYSEVVFINDFGTPYSLHPMLIKGFSFKKDGVQYQYASKLENRKWTFLKVIVESEGLSLYRSPDIAIENVFNGTELYARQRRARGFYLQRGDGEIIRMTAIGFRSKMRKLIGERTPELADKIGKKGYRFRDLEKIVREFNEEFEYRKIRM